MTIEKWDTSTSSETATELAKSRELYLIKVLYDPSEHFNILRGADGISISHFKYVIFFPGGLIDYMEDSLIINPNEIVINSHFFDLAGSDDAVVFGSLYSPETVHYRCLLFMTNDPDTVTTMSLYS